MATVVRGPLYIARREIAPVLILACTTVSGMPKTLYADPQQPSGKRVFPEYKHHPQIEWLPKQETTSRSKVLFADPALPVGKRAFPEYKQHSQLEYLHPNTAAGIPKALYADPLLPAGKGHLGDYKQHNRLETIAGDTTQDAPLSLFRGPFSLPAGSSAWVATPVPVRINPDTSRGLQKALYADPVLPPGKQLQPQYRQHELRLALNADTTFRSRLIYVSATIQIKTWNGLAQAQIKTYNALASASTKTANGVSNV